MSAPLITKTTTKDTRNGHTLARSLDKALLTQAIVDVDGSGFDSEDEKGEFAPLPLVERSVPPSHPGAVLRELYLPGTGLSQSQLAQRLGVSRRVISTLVQEHRSVTVDLAHRLSRAFGTTPNFWLKLQLNHDMWTAMHEHSAEYEAIEPLALAHSG